jgi:hypothetical protein
MKVLDENTPAVKVARAEDEDLPWARTEPAPAFKAAEAPKRAAVDDDEDDESLEFFKKLASK